MTTVLDTARRGADRIDTDPTAGPRSLRHLQGLADRLGDRLVRPGDAGWDAARAAWHLGVDQHPAAVAVPADLDEARAVLAAARAEGFAVTVQPRGHGAFASLEGTILVRPSAFDELTVDLERGVVRVGASRRWYDVLDALAGTGCIVPAGSSGDVSVVGYLLAGGHSWFSRSLGPGARSLRAVELLTADGVLRRIDDSSDPELIWALRGAGGAFGLVVAVELDLSPAPQLVGGRLVFDWGDARTVLETLAELAGKAPRELEVHVGVTRLPDLDELPPELRGARFVQLEVLYRGDPEAALPWIAWLRSAGTVRQDTVGPIGIEDLPALAGEPDDPSPSVMTAMLLQRLDRAVIDRMLAVFDEPAAGAVVSVNLRLLGGAFADRAGRPAIAAGFTAPFVMHAIAFGPRPAVDAGFAVLRGAVGDARASGLFASFLSSASYADAYGPVEIERLGRVKAVVDPEGRFVGNRTLG